MIRIVPHTEIKSKFVSTLIVKKKELPVNTHAFAFPVIALSVAPPTPSRLNSNEKNFEPMLHTKKKKRKGF